MFVAGKVLVKFHTSACTPPDLSVQIYDDGSLFFNSVVPSRFKN